VTELEPFARQSSMLSPQLPAATEASPPPVFDITNKYDTWEPTEEEYSLEYEAEAVPEELSTESKNTLWIPVATIGGLGITSALFYTVLKGMSR